MRLCREGAYLYTLTLTDIATGWTECFALLHRSQKAVVHALEVARQLLPFAMLGLDSDNGSEFINTEMFAYCQREKITFTRGRAYKKNDQCFVEHKNGAVVRELVGYDRFEGERAYRQLAEVYRAVRLYVNFFQPSMKLLTKRRDGSSVYRKYDAAQTPLQRLLATETPSAPARAHLLEVVTALDPVGLLRQIETLQDALWKLAVLRGATPASSSEVTEDSAVRFNPQVCVPAASRIVNEGEIPLQPVLLEIAGQPQRRKYRRTTKKREPRNYRTRLDPFSEVNGELLEWVKADPGRTAKSMFVELQQRYPAHYPDIQLRTLQRRVREWRGEMLIEFNDQWLLEDLNKGTILPKGLRGVRINDATEKPQPQPASEKEKEEITSVQKI